MLVTFNNDYLEKLYHKQKVPGKPRYDQSVVDIFIRRIDQFIAADNSGELRQLKSLHFEALKGDKQGLYSVRINRQYRTEFRLSYDQVELIEIVTIEDLSNHYS
ncbi:proteic killer suppression protein (plasmid) [Fibrisoma limi BUZ 3]|uniref:Proteic killer suppression protein n=1 Tax=Fibrisoma limi BUZ 3 TaxID=1185876 RepID=I2GU15_9BACT|nr:type II toxin-antitoxin system RelE/ParE family toxin [Fibrisoma limi]CCH57616.1 proteic killer suppression protein [Fibrisoma limi BUZ 3]